MRTDPDHDGPDRPSTNDADAPGGRLVRVGIALLVIPPILFLVTWQNDGSVENAGTVGSWPAFLMWPVGALLIGAGLLGRLIRRLDGRRD